MMPAERFSSPELNPAAQIAREQPLGGLDVLPEQYWTSLTAAKARAVAARNQETAKAAWVLETIGRAQDAFVRAFSSARGEEFKAAWDSLDRAENELRFVEQHYVDEGDGFGLKHMRMHIPRFQSLFPYRWGLSPAYLHKRVECSICGQRITLRSNCGHVSGEIYDGEMCVRRITEAEFLHFALVDAPAQRYSVVELDTTRPNFMPVRCLFRALRSPWDAWSVSREERRVHHPLFKNLARNDPCPCASGKKYKHCCVTSETVFPHFEFALEYPPPPEVLGLVGRPPNQATQSLA